MFYIGQRVICVDDHDCDHRLALNAAYIVSNVTPSRFGTFDGLEVEGVISPPFAGAWMATRFRPATDISVFTALLSTVPLHERERV